MAHRRKQHPRHSEPRRGARQPRFSAVSPYQLTRDDFQRMVATKRLRTTDEVSEWILMQSVEGHAQMGHGAFQGRRFPNTEMEDIVEALGREPRHVALQRQGLIDEVKDWAQHAMEGAAPHTLVNHGGDGLIGCGLLRHLPVEAGDVLRGLYLGGLRDDSDIRAEVEKRTGATIGGGHCRFVNVAVMERLGLDGDRLAREAHGDKIDSYRAEGMILDNPGPAAWDDPGIRYMYIRDRLGSGASDDAAIVAGGVMYNLSVALGVFLADAVDTLEKFVVASADQDADLALEIESHYSDLKLTRDDLYRLTWVCHVPREGEGKVPDSSLRHLLEVDHITDQTALESHLAYVCGHAYSPLTLGTEDVPNDEFYAWLETRIEACAI